MGSRILSRSFTVHKWVGGTEDEDAMVADPDISIGSGMDVDMDAPSSGDVPLDGTDSDDEDMEDPGDVAMVPMADMLNARFESENVRPLLN